MNQNYFELLDLTTKNRDVYFELLKSLDSKPKKNGYSVVVDYNKMPSEHREIARFIFDEMIRLGCKPEGHPDGTATIIWPSYKKVETPKRKIKLPEFSRVLPSTKKPLTRYSDSVWAWVDMPIDKFLLRLGFVCHPVKGNPVWKRGFTCIDESTLEIWHDRVSKVKTKIQWDIEDYIKNFSRL